MTSIAISLGCAACIFCGGVIGLNLHRLLPPRHLTKDTLDVIRLGTGMLSVLASLLLGLLIATAKSSFDSTELAVQGYAAELTELNEVLRDYGPGAAAPRDQLRVYVDRFVADLWPSAGQAPTIGGNPVAPTLLLHLREAIRALKPANEDQIALRKQAMEAAISLMRQRALLLEREAPSVQGLVLGVLVAWITAIFVSFGINAPRNSTIVAAFAICAVSIGAAIFLVLEMDSPLSGVLRISPLPVERVLSMVKW